MSLTLNNARQGCVINVAQRLAEIHGYKWKGIGEKRKELYIKDAEQIIVHIETIIGRYEWPRNDLFEKEAVK